MLISNTSKESYCPCTCACSHTSDETGQVTGQGLAFTEPTFIRKPSRYRNESENDTRTMISAKAFVTSREVLMYSALALTAHHNMKWRHTLQNTN